jgi:hypothetical protein
VNDWILNNAAEDGIDLKLILGPIFGLLIALISSGRDVGVEMSRNTEVPFVVEQVSIHFRLKITLLRFVALVISVWINLLWDNCWFLERQRYEACAFDDFSQSLITN